MTPASNNY